MSADGATQAQANPNAYDDSQIRLLQNWFKRAPGFIALLRGPDHVFELANEAYYDIVGTRDIIGRPAFTALPELRGQGYEELLKSVYSTGKPYVGRELKITVLRQPGDMLVDMFIDFVYQPVFDDAGSVCGIFLQGEDVTDRRRAMEALHDADRRKDEALAILAHEMKGPLQPLLQSLDSLRRAPGATELSHRRAVETIERQALFLNRLVDDLTDAVNLRSGRLSLHRAAISIQDIVARAVEICQPAIDACRHVLYVEAPAEPIEVDVDSHRMTQVIVNLLNNAAKYTPAGGVVTLSVEPVDEKSLTLRVSDNGIGIAPDQLVNIFDMFAQLSDANYRGRGGLGIGLTLVQRLLALHGGTVSAKSAGPGRGSEFVVTLPRLQESGHPGI